jgi:hypothetical protein
LLSFSHLHQLAPAIGSRNPDGEATTLSRLPGEYCRSSSRPFPGVKINDKILIPRFYAKRQPPIQAPRSKPLLGGGREDAVTPESAAFCAGVDLGA